MPRWREASYSSTRWRRSSGARGRVELSSSASQLLSLLSGIFVNGSHLGVPITALNRNTKKKRNHASDLFGVKTGFVRID